MLALPIFPGKPRIVPPLKNSPVDCFRRKTPFLSKRKEPDKRLALYVGITYLPGQAKDCPAVRDSPVDCHRQKKAPFFRTRLYVGITYLPGQSPAKYCRRT